MPGKWCMTVPSGCNCRILPAELFRWSSNGGVVTEHVREARSCNRSRLVHQYVVEGRNIQPRALCVQPVGARVILPVAIFTRTNTKRPVVAVFTRTNTKRPVVAIFTRTNTKRPVVAVFTRTNTKRPVVGVFTGTNTKRPVSPHNSGQGCNPRAIQLSSH
jgi:hypothetical protein